MTSGQGHTTSRWAGDCLLPLVLFSLSTVVPCLRMCYVYLSTSHAAPVTDAFKLFCLHYLVVWFILYILLLTYLVVCIHCSLALPRCSSFSCLTSFPSVSQDFACSTCLLGSTVCLSSTDGSVCGRVRIAGLLIPPLAVYLAEPVGKRALVCEGPASSDPFT